MENEKTAAIDNIKNNLQTITTLLNDLDEVTVVVLDNIYDANGISDQDNRAHEDLDEVAALCENIQNLIEHAMNKAERTTRIIENI